MLIGAKQAGVGPLHQLFRISQNVGEGFDAVVFRFSGRGLVEHREDRVRRLVRRAGSGTIDERQKMLVDEHALRKDARLVGLVQPAREIRLERSEEHTSELQSLMRISYAVFCLKKKNKPKETHMTKQK